VQATDILDEKEKEKEKKRKKPRTSRPPQEPTAAIAGTAPLIPFPPPTSAIPAPFDPATLAAIDHSAAEQLLARHMQAGLHAAAAASTPEAVGGDISGGGADGEGGSVGLTPDANGETSTKYTGVRRNKGGRYSARIKISGTNKCAAFLPELYLQHCLVSNLGSLFVYFAMNTRDRGDTLHGTLRIERHYIGHVAVGVLWMGCENDLWQGGA
jgi:hypothetical protein